MTDARPDPDALLKRAQTAGPGLARGRLKIFFGMSPGVGKTFAMLQEAQERRRQGIDVVAGYIETHKRPETDALKSGLEELSPKWVEYRGVALREFDLDAALARRPALVLVDELAHTNAEGLRHAKRYQDVLELLDASIDVFTTINVQHIESLNDVVAQITGTTVRETVPDSIIERADEIELIDTPPDELIQRLHDGKVYIADQARRAVDRFFRRDNLVALRELALRETAARVSEQVRVERAGRGDTRPWATSDRILVCVGPSPLSARVIRIARRMAAAGKAEWLAVSVEAPTQSEHAQAQVRRNLKLAERLGAEPVVLSGERIVDEILAYAVRNNVTKIVIGKPTRPRWREWLRGSIVDELIRRSGEIDIHVVKGEPEESAVALGPGDRRRSTNGKEYVGAAVVMGLCTLLAELAFPYLSAANLTMIYLAGVVFVATRYSSGPSALASVLAALLFNFFFAEPYFTFTIADGQLFVAFIVLLGTALVISSFAQRVRRQGEAARVRYLRTAALYFMSRKLAALGERDDLVKFVARHVADVFSGETAILLPDAGGQLTVAARHGGFSVEAPNEAAAARWVFEHGKWAGWSTETLPASQAIYMPLVASHQSMGVLALRPREPEKLLEPDQRHMLETFVTQLAIALERTAFAVQAEAARRQADAEQVRSSLLSCVSHDLRTPLAAIAGSASTLVDGERLSESTRRELAQSIAEEAARLNHLVSKLLDMTRLESAGFRLQKDWYPLDELVGAAITRLGAVLSDHRVTTQLPDDLPPLHVDGPLIDELLINLLENAARYTPRGTTIAVQAAREDGDVVVEVLDEGPGLPLGADREIFRRFVRHRPPGDRQGTGLGLAICEAITRLHGGQIGAENRREGGARFWFRLPKEADAPSARAFHREPEGTLSPGSTGAPESHR